jgi:hypothetical protein
MHQKRQRIIFSCACDPFLTVRLRPGMKSYEDVSTIFFIAVYVDDILDAKL